MLAHPNGIRAHTLRKLRLPFLAVFRQFLDRRGVIPSELFLIPSDALASSICINSIFRNSDGIGPSAFFCVQSHVERGDQRRLTISCIDRGLRSAVSSDTIPSSRVRSALGRPC